MAAAYASILIVVTSGVTELLKLLLKRLGKTPADLAVSGGDGGGCKR